MIKKIKAKTSSWKKKQKNSKKDSYKHEITLASDSSFNTWCLELDALKEYAKWYFSKMAAKITSVPHSLSYNSTLLHPYQETELIFLSLEFQWPRDCFDQ